MPTPFVIGKGTKIRIALLPVGDTTEPKSATLTSSATAIAQNLTATPTISLTGTIAAGVLIPAGSFVSFKAPATGKEVLVQLRADAKAGENALAVVSIPEAIAASSIAQYPLRLSGRTSADLDRKGKRTATVDFDSDGYSQGATTSIEVGIKAGGNWLPTDAGFCTAEFAFNELRTVYLWLELPKISDAYSQGRIYHGVASISSLPLKIGADNIITGDMDMNFEGKPNFTPDKPIVVS